MHSSTLDLSISRNTPTGMVEYFLKPVRSIMAMGSECARTTQTNLPVKKKRAIHHIKRFMNAFSPYHIHQVS